MRYFYWLIILVLFACGSSKPSTKNPPKPAWLSTKPYQDGYYTGIGHSTKDGSNNYIQAAKKSALDDLVSEIKVTVSSTSVLSQLDVNKEFSERYEQIIKTTAADEIEEFETVDAWEDENNYWIYYRLSIARYRQIKEEQKRNATLLATDYFKKGIVSESNNEKLQAIGFYFQALRSVEKYLAEPVRAKIDGNDILLVNETYAKIQTLLDKINVSVNPSEISVNRRVAQEAQSVLASAKFKDTNTAAKDVPLSASFEKGAGVVFPDYKTNENGQAKILITKIDSRDLEQKVGVKINVDALSGTASSQVYSLIAKTFKVPSAVVVMKVQRPVVYLKMDEKSLGNNKNNFQITNKLKNLLANSGFEFTSNLKQADLVLDVNADTEKGSVNGSIHITYLTGLIKVALAKEDKVIYSTTLDRIKGYGLDFERSSQDAYNRSLETLEKERFSELLNTILQ
ncbi:MAG: LPP20 family lipoprotein [Cyclobacteriaceae bacterium]|nr:LPP20 family lipoprotein [Flammeovirgaceae bacterium]MCZ8023042.1 LPP20 family lipoprotein [Cytophagales bacterium]MCZ8326684.1 LPP20 family lipoprotein [Cyclobacteriaceae bacterium]